jgi:hypothetical protein
VSDFLQFSLAVRAVGCLIDAAHRFDAAATTRMETLHPYKENRE